jgi:hypothetical protein
MKIRPAPKPENPRTTAATSAAEAATQKEISARKAKLGMEWRAARQ